MLPTQNKPPQYRSYLLRCWETRIDHPGHPATWRFSLQDSQTGQRCGFADLGALVTFLQTELGISNLDEHQHFELGEGSEA
jgi:hypothetical protein